MTYSKEFKESFIKEFLERYQKDSKLSIRQFGLEKFGKPISFIYNWLSKFDVNHIYKYNKSNKLPEKALVIKPEVSNSPVVKITNNDKNLYSTARANISIKFNNALIDMGNCYSKEDLILVLSALKEVNNVN